MPSQLEILKQDVKELEARGGPESPLLKGLRMQIAMYEKPRAENPVDNQETYSVGMRKE